MGDYEMGRVCECVHPLVCHTVFSKSIVVTHFFSKETPNGFYVLQYFLSFVDLGYKLSE